MLFTIIIVIYYNRILTYPQSRVGWTPAFRQHKVDNQHQWHLKDLFWLDSFSLPMGILKQWFIWWGNFVWLQAIDDPTYPLGRSSGIVNWYTSGNNCAIELVVFLWCYARWGHWMCGYTQLEAATINHLHAPVTALCSAAMVPKFMNLKFGPPWDNDQASWSSVLPQTHQKAKVLPLVAS